MRASLSLCVFFGVIAGTWGCFRLLCFSVCMIPFHPVQLSCTLNFSFCFVLFAHSLNLCTYSTGKLSVPQCCQCTVKLG